MHRVRQLRRDVRDVLAARHDAPTIRPERKITPTTFLYALSWGQITVALAVCMGKVLPVGF